MLQLKLSMVKVTARVRKRDLTLLRKFTKKKPSELIRDLVTEKAEEYKKSETGPHASILKCIGTSTSPWDEVMENIYRDRKLNHGRNFSI